MVMSVRIQEKFTLHCSCTENGLIGSGLGSKSNIRAAKIQGFGLSVILILVYYVFSFVSSAFGVKGIFSPYLSAWLPVIVSLLGGIYLLKRST